MLVLGAAKSTIAVSDDQSQENELKQLTYAWIDAINAKDRPTLDKLMAPDFVPSGWDGSWHVDRARWIDNLFQVIDIQEYVHSGINAAVYGDVATVTSNWYWRGERETDEKKPFEEHGYVVDVWRRDGKSWRVVSRTTIIIPGKEESPKQPPAAASLTDKQAVAPAFDEI